MEEYTNLQNYIEENDISGAMDYLVEMNYEEKNIKRLFEAKILITQAKHSDAETILFEKPRIKDLKQRNLYESIQRMLLIELKLSQGKQKEAELDIKDLEKYFNNNELVTIFLDKINKKSISKRNSLKKISTIKNDSSEKDTFLKLYRENSQIKEQSRWYVVDTSWFLKWKAKVGLKKKLEYSDLPFNSLWEDYSETTTPRLDNSQLIDNTVPEEMISTEDSPSYYSLKSGLSENIDFILLPEQAYLFLKKLYNPHQNILRIAIKRSDNSCIIEVFLKKIIIGYNSSHGAQLKIHKTSSKALLNSFIPLLIQKSNLSLTPDSNILKKFKFWIINTDITSQSKFITLINDQPANAVIEGSKILNRNICVEEAEISEKSILFIDNGLSGRFQLTESSDFVLCSVCKSTRNYKDLVLCSVCKVKTCSEKCLTKHKKFNTKCAGRKKRLSIFSCFCRPSLDTHKSEIHFQSSAKVKNSDPEINFETKNHSLTSSGTSTNSISPSGSYSIITIGLQNLGNTCFMNSAIQCLVHCEDLTRFFLCEDYTKKINKSNPLGTKGKLALAYADILKTMKSGKDMSIAPWSLKKTISSVAAQFEGYQQHDSHEFLNYLISGLHEDLNEIRKKPYDGSDIKFTNDQEVADESWKRHSSRNKSVIVDLMYGQYKSTLNCPKCMKVSFAFDPYNCLSLPIPQSNIKKIEVFFIPYSYDEEPVSMICFYEGNSTILDIKEQVAMRISKNSNELKVFDCKFKIPNKVVKEDLRVEVIRQSQCVFYEVPNNAEAFCVITVCFEGLATELSPRLIQVDQKETFSSLLEKVSEHMLPLLKQLLPNSTQNPESLYRVYTQSNQSICCFICDQPRCTMACKVKPSNDKISKFLKKTNFLNIKVQISRNKQRNDIMRFTKFNPLKNSSKTHNGVSIQKCFQAFSMPETLDKHNSWYCPYCKTHVQATKRLEIYRVPPILVIHLKRFKIHSYMREKNNFPIEFPKENFDISDFVIGEKPPLYDLFAVSNHFGTLLGGHYTATVYNTSKGRWYECNDSQISETSNISDTASYVLFYKAKNSVKV